MAYLRHRPATSVICLQTTKQSIPLHASDITGQNQEQHIASCILSSFRFITHLGLDENPTRLDPRAYGPRCNRGDSGQSVQESGHHNAALARLRWSLELHGENICVLFSCGIVSARAGAKGQRKFNIWNCSRTIMRKVQSACRKKPDLLLFYQRQL